jgi:hypothetical protein
MRVIPFAAAGLTLAFAAAPASPADSQSTSVLQGVGPVVMESELAGSPSGLWVAAAPIPQGVVRYAHAQCLGENRFYVISGVTTGGTLTGQVARYDASTNAWTPLAAFPAPSEGPTGVCYQGKIYVAGGSQSLAVFRIYDIATNTWSTGAAIPRSVVMASMGAHAGRIYLVGGDNDFSPGTGVSNLVNIYDIATNTWLANGANMPTAAVSPGFAQNGTFLYVVGGWGVSSPGTNVNQSMRYDMATNTWTVGPTFTTARGDHVLAASQTALYAIGGDNNGGGFFDMSATVERLDVSTWPAGTWTAADPLPSARSGHKGGFCTQTFTAGAGEVWSTGGIAAPFPTFTNTNQYLAAEACPAAAVAMSLAVDAAGNGVLDPNEPPVIMAPSWRNPGGAAIPNLTGTASNFTGPAGGTYTISDSTASYGTVAAGATATCTDCYGIGVTAAARPVLHWDAAITETLSVGAIEDWTLHIGGTFDDVSTTSPFYRFIETLLHHGVTGGCSATGYCPLSNTTREQMAVFVLIAKEGAGYAPPACAPPNLFSDVPETSPFCRFIEELANRQVVAGCGPNLYCPTANVTREQMSIFVLRTLDTTLNPPACVAGSEMFNDVPSSSPFCRWIEELARRGVVTGCGGGAYCPTAPVTREQMGVFISVTFGLTLYGPA